jgi:hypothetical protein
MQIDEREREETNVTNDDVFGLVCTWDRYSSFAQIWLITHEIIQHLHICSFLREQNGLDSLFDTARHREGERLFYGRQSIISLCYVVLNHPIFCGAMLARYFHNKLSFFIVLIVLCWHISWLSVKQKKSESPYFASVRTFVPSSVISRFSPHFPY